MLSQTMKFLLGSLVLALMVSSQVQAAAIPVASLRATDMGDFTPAPASNSAAARRSSEMLEMRDTYSGTAEWGSQRRSLASLASPSQLKGLAAKFRTTGNGEKKETVDGPKKKGFHQQFLGHLSSTFGKKKEEAPNPPKPGAEPPKPPTEPPKPHDPAAPHPEGKNNMEKAKDLAELGTTAAGTAGAVASTYKGIKGDGGATPAPDGSPTGGVGDASNGPTVPAAGKTA
ncbi:hypothetical protein F5879DRAFT_992261 [Lentinula edodes]|uniref:Uncharacterized protein n=1 Tax=Lentinula edodes TaxID=5353 RepID=A0A1Q3E6L7_LENED|nr:hypothetical protein HHX47_DHR10000061 [Lentinula edodes]KAJ3901100.1 hypothetical protein F5879DRAFT_992261 [Lentinula edodes]KAJ3914362.1 hypothetical protein F5877DRAFT_82875 [Lentinula edodes]GAW02796.1 hypothetical protein LENED_004466 [Lentinula edodes]